MENNELVYDEEDKNAFCAGISENLVHGEEDETLVHGDDKDSDSDDSDKDSDNSDSKNE